MNDLSMFYQEFDNRHPQLIFLTGKTCTGKTTLSNSLKEKYDCAVIELDSIVSALKVPDGTQRFIAAYRERSNIQLTNAFVAAVKQKITESLITHTCVIIEGALANSQTLNEIVDSWKNSFLIIYLDIRNVQVYTQRLQSRFEFSTKDDGNGLPAFFWEQFNPEQLEVYYANRIITPDIRSAITRYAAKSAEESKSRLATFEAAFDRIVKVEI